MCTGNSSLRVQPRQLVVSIVDVSYCRIRMRIPKSLLQRLGGSGSDGREPASRISECWAERRPAAFWITSQSVLAFGSNRSRPSRDRLLRSQRVQTVTGGPTPRRLFSTLADRIHCAAE